MADSDAGALVVTILDAWDTGTTVTRRLFGDHSAFIETHAEPGEDPIMGPHEGQDDALSIPGGARGRFAILPDDADVYWHSLSGAELYNRPMGELTDFGRGEDTITNENPARIDQTDGMVGDDQGVYHTNLDDSITRWNYREAPTETIVHNSHWIHWPDSVAWVRKGTFTSQHPRSILNQPGIDADRSEFSKSKQGPLSSRPTTDTESFYRYRRDERTLCIPHQPDRRITILLRLG